MLKCARKSAELTFAARRLPGFARLRLCLGRFGRRRERLVEGERCCVGPFFVSHSMRSRPSAILGRTSAGTHQIAIGAKLTAQTTSDGPEMRHRARFDLCVGIRNADVVHWSANRKLWGRGRKITSCEYLRRLS